MNDDDDDDADALISAEDLRTYFAKYSIIRLDFAAFTLNYVDKRVHLLIYCTSELALSLASLFICPLQLGIVCSFGKNEQLLYNFYIPLP